MLTDLDPGRAGGTLWDREGKQPEVLQGGASSHRGGQPWAVPGATPVLGTSWTSQAAHGRPGRVSLVPSTGDGHRLMGVMGQRLRADGPPPLVLPQARAAQLCCDPQGLRALHGHETALLTPPGSRALNLCTLVEDPCP